MDDTGGYGSRPWQRRYARGVPFQVEIPDVLGAAQAGPDTALRHVIVPSLADYRPPGERLALRDLARPQVFRGYLARLRDGGALTDEEFAAAKLRLPGR